MTKAMAKLKDAISQSYAEWNEMFSKDTCDEFTTTISFVRTTKYIRVMANKGVWGFIVNVHNDKVFAYGDLLKTKSSKGPARNFARGNVFDEYEANWTGM